MTSSARARSVVVPRDNQGERSHCFARIVPEVLTIASPELLSDNQDENGAGGRLTEGGRSPTVVRLYQGHPSVSATNSATAHPADRRVRDHN
jgi:hypothetical protein